MKVLLLLTAVIMAFGPIQIQGSLAEFRQMILLKTGKRAETSYAFYGCHCGMGGRGSPKDATDRCCVAHDCCYYRLQKHNCGTKFLTYKFSYRGGKITCSGGGGSQNQQKKVELLLSRFCYFEFKENRDYGGRHHVPTSLAQTYSRKTARAIACAKLRTEQN
ncbi:Phospholipase A2, membrane associated [Microtus ochrogaster]|uniref:Phospholipase A2 n=1 Tax=Microtus ochrogaster TaxID=79684 RepID=A0A8J6KLR0_MICOH|nr:Phospholipase A2, membrane associated [Microtus ochrogaster]